MTRGGLLCCFIIHLEMSKFEVMFLLEYFGKEIVKGNFERAMCVDGRRLIASVAATSIVCNPLNPNQGIEGWD